MSVERDHARRIASLARLHFEDAELTRITEELNHILEHVEALRSLGAEEASDAATTSDATSTRGPDADQPDALRDEIGTFAPDWREGFFVVPPLPGVHAGEGE
jgi:aspartyl-tRNA(Asn)/glutamyl-tRNA(Gln) amidotransferase subunit C